MASPSRRLGSVDQVIHLWGFASMADREARRGQVFERLDTDRNRLFLVDDVAEHHEKAYADLLARRAERLLLLLMLP